MKGSIRTIAPAVAALGLLACGSESDAASSKGDAGVASPTDTGLGENGAAPISPEEASAAAADEINAENADEEFEKLKQAIQDG